MHSVFVALQPALCHVLAHVSGIKCCTVSKPFTFRMIALKFGRRFCIFMFMLSSVLAQRLAGMSVFELTYFV